jgi:hypothetical protein
MREQDNAQKAAMTQNKQGSYFRDSAEKRENQYTLKFSCLSIEHMNLKSNFYVFYK